MDKCEEESLKKMVGTKGLEQIAAVAKVYGEDPYLIACRLLWCSIREVQATLKKKFEEGSRERFESSRS